MDLQTTIIAAILMALCIIPLVWAYRKKKEKQQLLVKQLKAHAISSGCNITDYDLWHNTVIGLDGNANCLFFLRKGKNGEILKQVHLAGISRCYISGDDNGTIEKLELVLVHKSSREADTVLEFYNTEWLMQINTELELVRKWQAMIDERVGN